MRLLGKQKRIEDIFNFKCDRIKYNRIFFDVQVLHELNELEESLIKCFAYF